MAHSHQKTPTLESSAIWGAAAGIILYAGMSILSNLFAGMDNGNGTV
jgi:hypothetical protein